jgi:catechol 2,3-dioxygenase-like lactoylglutathione lyase family enzyme
MSILGFHHITLPVTDIERATDFYANVLGLSPLPRPPFKSVGAWFAFGNCQLHLIVEPDGTFRRDPNPSTTDAHFALAVSDFEAMIAALKVHGFREDAPEGDPMRMYVRRKTTAGFAQAFILDPELHVIEINAAAMVTA